MHPSNSTAHPRPCAHITVSRQSQKPSAPYYHYISRTIAKALGLALASLISLNASAHPLTTTHKLPNTLQQATQAVVNLSVQKKMDPQIFALLKKQSNLPSNLPLPKLGFSGSGVIVSAQQGYIMTNDHVVKQAQAVIVSLKSGDHYKARIIGEDPNDDLALLKIDAKEPLTALNFANSQQLNIGQNVIAIGQPFGLEESVTAGVISALDRDIPVTAERSQSFMQTDAPINPGNSGGALIDQQGRLVGMNTAIISTSDQSAGVGFAIPSNTVAAIYHQLAQFGKVEHGMLGVIVQNITPDLARVLQLKQQDGIIVTQVNPLSAAAKAGVEPQDIITQVNHTQIHNAQQLHNLLALKRPACKINLSIIRQHKPMLLGAQLMTLKQASMQHIIPHLDGMDLADYDELQNNSRQVQGVVVKSLDPTSDGALAGLAPGDVIIQANQYKVPNLSSLIQIIANKPQQELFLVVNHHAVQEFVVLR